MRSYWSSCWRWQAVWTAPCQVACCTSRTGVRGSVVPGHLRARPALAVGATTPPSDMDMMLLCQPGLPPSTPSEPPRHLSRVPWLPHVLGGNGRSHCRAPWCECTVHSLVSWTVDHNVDAQEQAGDHRAPAACGNRTSIYSLFSARAGQEPEECWEGGLPGGGDVRAPL